MVLLGVMSSQALTSLNSNVQDMVQQLESVVHTSSAPIDAEASPLGGTICTGLQERPALDIRPEHLLMLRDGRTMLDNIADIYQCSGRTICRRLLDYGMTEPGPPVYTMEIQDTGSTVCVY
jgi:hypothetical protein